MVKSQIENPCTTVEDGVASSGEWNAYTNEHIDKVTDKVSSVDMLAMAHTPIPSNKIRQIKGARDAVDDEFNYLMDQGTWPIASVREKSEVIAEARRTGKKVHFGCIMELCHLKNSQLPAEYHKYKGRVVFRGDIIKDEEGAYALFSEQGASASSIEAARLVDVIARMPGCGGYNVDAIKAFNQVTLGEDCPETWCALPRHRWPETWEGKYTVPVVLLERNLYGHPRAGHYWEQHVARVCKGNGFRPVPG